MATGSAPLTYQWYNGSTAISGATAASYTTPAATAAESGSSYHVTVRNGSGSVTSNSATLTVTASVGGNLIVNGGFESGATGWTATPAGVIGQFGTEAPPYAGTWDAWLCGNAATSGSVSQTVTIPSTVSKATLVFALHIASAGRSTGTFRAQVLKGGTVLATLGSFTQASAATGYQAHSCDLSSYAGQTVTVQFSGSAGRSRRSRAGTSFTLDNVSLDTQ